MISPVRKLVKPTSDADGLFKALADPSRRRMLDLLAEHELPLKRIEEQFSMSRPAVIKHLRILKACRLVKVRKRGRETIHRLDSRPLRVVKDWVSHFEMLWHDHLNKLKQQVEADK